MAAASQPELGGYLPLVRELMASLPAEKRAKLNQLWSGLRNTLIGQERTIEDLEHALANSGLASQLPARPPSSASVVSIRDAIDRALVENSNDLEPATTHSLDALLSLPPR